MTMMRSRSPVSVAYIQRRGGARKVISKGRKESVKSVEIDREAARLPETTVLQCTLVTRITIPSSTFQK